MTTLTEYLKANPDMTEVVIAKRYNVGDTTTKSLVLGIDAEFRAKLALIGAYTMTAYSLILLLDIGPEILWTYPTLQACLHAALDIGGTCFDVRLLNGMNEL
jgi:hypothetical protein